MGQSAEGTEAGGVHGFAPELTSFVGRADAVREVAGLLGESRLVTVTGPGGSGETRLAGQVAGQVAGRSREAGDLWNQMGLLPKMAILDLRAGRIGDAAALLREALQIAARTGARG